MVFLETSFSFSFLLLMGQIIFSKTTMWYVCTYRHTHISHLTQYAFLRGIDMPPSRGVGLCFLSLNLCRHEGSSECWVLSQHGFGAQLNDQEHALCGEGACSFYFLLCNGIITRNSTRESFFNPVTSGFNVKANRYI